MLKIKHSFTNSYLKNIRHLVSGHGFITPDKSHPEKKPPGFSPPGKKPAGEKGSWTKIHPEKSHHVKIELGKKPAVKKPLYYKPLENMPYRQKSIQKKSLPNPRAVSLYNFFTADCPTQLMTALPMQTMSPLLTPTPTKP